MSDGKIGVATVEAMALRAIAAEYPAAKVKSLRLLGGQAWYATVYLWGANTDISGNGDQLDEEYSGWTEKDFEVSWDE